MRSSRALLSLALLLVPVALPAQEFTTADPVIQRAQECEALFYGGQYLLTRGRTAEGKDLLRQSLGACPPSRALHNAARIELGEGGKGR